MKRYPFKFLEAYNQEDTDIFFGREQEVNVLYEMIFQHSIILVYGASGTGKTSLIQCGLAGKFKSYDWLPITVRRGSNINVSLEKALIDAGGNEISEEDEIITQNEKKLTGLSKLIKEVYLSHFKPVYIIFDQFEELYILGNKKESEQFISSIKAILAAEQLVKLIFSIREEYLGYLYDFERAVPQLLRKKLRVEPVTIDMVSSIFTGINNCNNSNVSIKTDEVLYITEEIFNRLRGKKNILTIQLPYLQVFLDKLYLKITNDESRQTQALITKKALSGIGDIGDVLRDFLEEQVKDISLKKSSPITVVSVDVIWKILSPFSTLEGTKDPIQKSELQSHLKDVNENLIDECIAELVNRRILNYSETTNRYELVHDSLAKCIAEKRSDDEIKLLEVRRLIKNQVAIKSDARELFTERQLIIVEPYLDRLSLSDDENELIMESRKAVLKHKSIKNRKRWFIGLGIFTVIAIVAVTFIGIIRNNKEKEAERARSNNLTRFKELAKKAYRNENKLQGYLYVVEALALVNNAETHDSLVKEVSKWRRLPVFGLDKILLHEASVIRAAFGPGDSSIYTWSNKGLLRQWSLQTGNLIREAGFEPKNKRYVYGEDYETVIFSNQNFKSFDIQDTLLLDSSHYYKKRFIADLVDSTSPEFELPQFPEIVRSISGAYYSNDRKKKITWGTNTESIYDGVDLWDDEGLNLGPSLIHDGIDGAIFSKDNSMILTWGSDSTARIWKNMKNDASIFHMAPEMMKLKAQIQTGVEISSSDQSIKIIYPAECIKKKGEYQVLFNTSVNK